MQRIHAFLAGSAVAVVTAVTATACLIPGQHTLVTIEGTHAASAHVDLITFRFQQGAPEHNSAASRPRRPVRPAFPSSSTGRSSSGWIPHPPWPTTLGTP